MRESDANVAHAKRRPRLSIEQIRAACRIHESHLPQWQEADAALDRLRERLPELDVPSVLLKVAAVNALYGTNLYAVQRMAEHIVAIFFAWDRSRHMPELVERLARLPPAQPGGRVRTHLSFASKFAHFFLADEVFPIFDKYACDVLALHLGVPRSRYKGSGAYLRFAADFARLKSEATWTGSGRELDRYLWLAGLRRAWLANPKSQINAEARGLFEAPTEEARDDLARLLP